MTMLETDPIFSQIFEEFEKFERQEKFKFRRQHYKNKFSLQKDINIKLDGGTLPTLRLKYVIFVI
jgi:hypothetical protein